MYQIGFDVGGTNIAAGLVDEGLELVKKVSRPFPTGKSCKEIAAIMADVARELLNGCGAGEASLESIGIAVPGSVSRDLSRVVHAYNLMLHDAPLKADVQAHFHDVPVYLANDADAAALAELYKGAFQGCQTAVLYTLGTGVGGGVILNGKMFRGGLGQGVEPGHAVLAHRGELCTCGTHGCVEALCTATWLIKEGRRNILEYPVGLLHNRTGGDVSLCTAKLVIDCAKAGDAFALDIFERYVDALGSTVASIINILDPEVIAIGGGVSGAGEFLFAPLRENAGAKAFFKETGRIVPAQTGNDAGIFGAAMLKRDAER